MRLLRYIKFCWKVWNNLSDFEMFENYDGSQAKSYRLEMKTVDQKMRMAKKKGKQPKKEHVFLSMFYETIATKENQEKREEFITLFCLLFFWWHSIEDHPAEEE